MGFRPQFPYIWGVYSPRGTTTHPANPESAPRALFGARRFDGMRFWLAIVVVVVGMAAVLIPSGTAGASSVQQWCAGEVTAVGQQVAPFRTRLGGQISLTIATTAAERAELVKTTGLDSTGLTLGSRRSDGQIQARVIIDCTEIGSQSQQTALRFLALHEIAHALQFISEPDPSAKSPEQHEREADCAANILIRNIYDTRLALSYGAHGGCQPDLYQSTAAWLDAVATATPPVPAKVAKRATGMMRKPKA